MRELSDDGIPKLTCALTPTFLKKHKNPSDNSLKVVLNAIFQCSDSCFFEIEEVRDANSKYLEPQKKTHFFFALSNYTKLS